MQALKTNPPFVPLRGNPPRPRRGAWRWLAAGLLLALPAAGQPRDAELLVDGEIAAVRVIHLEVVVSERGNRVSGLEAEDFSLLVDGREVPIDYFSEVYEGRVPAAPEPAVRATSYLIFIDDFFGVAVYRNRILRALRAQLPLLGPEDRLAIAAFDGSKVEVLSDWTRSPVQLNAAFDRAMERTAHGLRRIGEGRRMAATTSFFQRTAPGSSFSNIGFAGARRGASDLGLDASRSSRKIPTQLGLVVEAVALSLRSFAGAPGRKVALLIADGWPPFPEVGPSPEMVPTRPRVLAPLIDTANLLEFTLYPVDYQAGAQGILDFLADSTGGRAFFGNAGLKVLERAVEDTRSYYYLGFTPSFGGEEPQHRIKVELRRRGLKARSRTTFPDPSRLSEATGLIDRVELDDFPSADGPPTGAVPDGEPSRR
ncbi:MAG: VWA domain-containing protein [bacterium]|nr:VWA domain-containing protein [bacterium]